MDIYEKLADYLDQLPAGFPRTKGGAEMRILRKLFSPEDASLAMHLSLIAEEPRVIAYRAGISKDEAERRLKEMDSGRADLNPVRCIGCGLCVSTCTSGALTLQRKPDREQSYVPVNLRETYIRLGQARGKMSIPELIGLEIRSVRDRILSKRII